MLRVQLFTKLFVRRGNTVHWILDRTLGGLTGSTLALTLARIPVESSISELLDERAFCGFPLEETRLVYASWVDNLYAASTSPGGARENLRVLFETLKRKWNLDLKQGSACCLGVKGCVESSDESLQGSDIPLVVSANILGWEISNDASLHRQWQILLKKVWAAYFANIRCKSWRRLGIPRRLKLLDRAIKPVVLYFLKPWVPTMDWLEKLRRLQNHLLSRCLGNYKLSVEDYATYAKRCGKMVKEHLGVSVSDWTKLWIEGSFSWNDHLERDWAEQCRSFREGLAQTQETRSFATCFSWAASLSRFHASKWLAARRVLTVNEVGRAPSRTNTRAVRGVVRPRYHDAMDALKDTFPFPLDKCMWLR